MVATYNFGSVYRSIITVLSNEVHDWYIRQGLTFAHTKTDHVFL